MVCKLQHQLVPIVFVVDGLIREHPSKRLPAVTRVRVAAIRAVIHGTPNPQYALPLAAGLPLRSTV